MNLLNQSLTGPDDRDHQFADLADQAADWLTDWSEGEPIGKATRAELQAAAHHVAPTSWRVYDAVLDDLEARLRVANRRTRTTTPKNPSTSLYRDSGTSDRDAEREKLRQERYCQDFRGVVRRSESGGNVYKIGPCRMCESCRMWRVAVSIERALVVVGKSSFQHAPMDAQQYSAFLARIRRHEKHTDRKIARVTIPISESKRIVWATEPMGPAERVDTAETVEGYATTYQQEGHGRWGQQSASGRSLAAVEADIMGEELKKPEPDSEDAESAEVVGYFNTHNLAGDTAEAKADSLGVVATEAGVTLDRLSPSSWLIVAGDDEARGWFNTRIGYRPAERPAEPPVEAYEVAS